MESNSHNTGSIGTCARIMICIRFFAICLAVSFLPEPACRAATIRVPADQPTIQAGIDAAADGDIVLVADGTYTGDGNRDIDFKGKAITVTSENGSENCIIDSEGSDTDWHRGFIFQSGETPNSILDGFCVQNGFHEDGGGMYCLNASPVIVNCSLVNNTAGNRGGGLYCESSSPALIGCFLGDNNAIERGGGLYCAAFCTLNIKDTSFVLNSADGGGGFYGYQTSTVTFDNCLFFMNNASWGGGIFGDCNMTLTTCTFEMNSAETGAGSKHSMMDIVSFNNCTFNENRASKDGGGLYCRWSFIDMHQCLFTGNEAGGSGGGMYVYWYSELDMDQCTFTDNKADYNGGALYNEDSITESRSCSFARNMAGNCGGGVYGIIKNKYKKLTFVDCSFTGNAAEKAGGGLYSYNNATSQICNCTFSDNVTKKGGAICCLHTSRLPVINTTFVRNNAEVGGSLYLYWVWECSITNSVLWDNHPIGIYDDRQLMQATFSNIQGGWPGPGNIDKDPLFIGTGEHPLTLSSLSPCIDAGTDRDAPGTDIRGFDRPMGGAPDMGAYEYQGGWPFTTRVYVRMLSHQFAPGDTVNCRVDIWNAEQKQLTDYPLFVLLDVLGSIYWAPGFTTDPDCYVIDVPPGLSHFTVLPDFSWPEDTGTIDGIVWYAALAFPDMAALVGEIGVFDFGWSDD